MANANVNQVSVSSVRKSFQVTLDVAEKVNQQYVVVPVAKAREAFKQSDELAKQGIFQTVYFEGDEALAERCEALPPAFGTLLMFSPNAEVRPIPAHFAASVHAQYAAIDDIAQARNILQSLYNEGTLDCFTEEATYDAINRMGQLMARAEAALSSGVSS